MSGLTKVAWFFVWWIMAIVIMLGLEKLAYGDVSGIHLWTFLVSLIVTIPIEVFVMNRLDPPTESE